MTEEQKFFLCILRDHLHREPTNPPDSLNWEILTNYAVQHKLGGICWYQCKDYLRSHYATNPICKTLEQEFNGSLFHAIHLQTEKSAIFSSFAKANIPFVPIKGAVLASYYPEPALRTMGDLDLLIHPEDRDSTRDILKSLGYSVTRWSEREWDYAKHLVHLELQADLLHGSATKDSSIRDYINDYWPHVRPVNDGSELALELEFHLLYLIAHIAKHLRSAGVGLRQFFDLSVLTEYPGFQINWELFREEAEAARLWEFSKSCFTLCHRWFGSPQVLPDADFSEEFFESVTNHVFNNGVFGFDNEVPHSRELLMERERSHLPLPLLKMRVMRRKLFPRYRDLITLTKYQGLKGRPWLLPWYWIKRLFIGFKTKRGNRAVGNVIHMKDSDLSDREQRLKELGL